MAHPISTYLFEVPYSILRLCPTNSATLPSPTS